tara:strand:+ start:2447 stop:2578 length:132 start_codon:yes stop_codon:yes gene_type:complete
MKNFVVGDLNNSRDKVFGLLDILNIVFATSACIKKNDKLGVNS